MMQDRLAEMEIKLQKIVGLHNMQNDLIRDLRREISDLQEQLAAQSAAARGAPQPPSKA